MAPSNLNVSMVTEVQETLNMETGRDSSMDTSNVSPLELVSIIGFNGKEKVNMIVVKSYSLAKYLIA